MVNIWPKAFLSRQALSRELAVISSKIDWILQVQGGMFRAQKPYSSFVLFDAAATGMSTGSSMNTKNSHVIIWIGRHDLNRAERAAPMKEEGLRRILLPLRLCNMRIELLRFMEWYNFVRPHMSLAGATPAEVYHARRPANRRRRFEPRARYPARSPCAAPQITIRGERGCKLRLIVSNFEAASHLPLVEIERAA